MFDVHKHRAWPPVSFVCHLRGPAIHPTERRLRFARLLRVVAASKRFRSCTVAATASGQAGDAGDGRNLKPFAPQSSSSATPSSAADKAKSKNSTDPKANTSPHPQQPPAQGLGLRKYHYATFFSILVAGLLCLAVLLYLQADIQIQQACFKVLRRLLKTVALRQVSACPRSELTTAALILKLSPGHASGSNLCQATPDHHACCLPATSVLSGPSSAEPDTVNLKAVAGAGHGNIGCHDLCAFWPGAPGQADEAAVCRAWFLGEVFRVLHPPRGVQNLAVEPVLPDSAFLNQLPTATLAMTATLPQPVCMKTSRCFIGFFSRLCGQHA